MLATDELVQGTGRKELEWSRTVDERLDVERYADSRPCDIGIQDRNALYQSRVAHGSGRPR